MALGLSVVANFVLVTGTDVSAQQNCAGCSVVREYGLRSIQVGAQYRMGSGVPIVVAQVDASSRQVLVYPAGYPNSQRNWISADEVYTEDRAYEHQQMTGLAASCVSYAAARQDGNTLMALLFQGACCRSNAARTYGTPPGLC